MSIWLTSSRSELPAYDQMLFARTPMTILPGIPRRTTDGSGTPDERARLGRREERRVNEIPQSPGRAIGLRDIGRGDDREDRPVDSVDGAGEAHRDHGLARSVCPGEFHPMCLGPTTQLAALRAPAYGGCHGRSSSRGSDHWSTSLRTRPLAPDGRLVPTNAESVVATSIVWIARWTLCGVSPAPAKMTGTKVS